MDMHMDMSSMHMGPSSAEYKASNDPFLQTLARCFHTHCSGVPNSTLEKIWEIDIVGRQRVQPVSVYSYQTVLSVVPKAPPTDVVDSEAVLNTASLVDEDGWLGNFNCDQGFEIMEIVTERYGIVLIATCSSPRSDACHCRKVSSQDSTPRSSTRVYNYGKYNAAPVLGPGFVPKRDQSLFHRIHLIILSSVGYVVTDPMSWYGFFEQQLIAYIDNRVGIPSFVNLTLVILFSSRNNVLLFVWNWSNSTFLLVHWWIAVICMLQACLHSATYLQFYLAPLTAPGAYGGKYPRLLDLGHCCHSSLGPGHALFLIAPTEEAVRGGPRIAHCSRYLRHD
ncbi:hypothetical protein jhhlp_000780 [Lomentospora prolificans]|uniref:Ferric oxidoreductase domain-containing protein n=1 Tax=Lomentospora prolificans TaxID=41688 RepID=A0A2N3NJP9_9PEZI|nr:hypothetical protein jhhlp_000780 [Lomentospora prolificans]